MKAGSAFASLFILFLFTISSAASACETPLDGSSIFVGSGYDLCTGNYSDLSFSFNESDSYLNCNDSVLSYTIDNLSAVYSSLDNIRISNCVFQNMEERDTGNSYAINLAGVFNAMVSNVSFYDFGGGYGFGHWLDSIGIYAFSTENSSFEGVYCRNFSRKSPCIYFNNSANNSVRNVFVDGLDSGMLNPAYGALLERSARNFFYNFSAANIDNSKGIYLNNSDYNEFSGFSFSNLYLGIGIWLYPDSDYNVFRNGVLNELSNPGPESGISVQVNSDGNYFENISFSNIREAEDGVFVQQSSGNQFRQLSFNGLYGNLERALYPYGIRTYRSTNTTFESISLSDVNHAYCLSSTEDNGLHYYNLTATEMKGSFGLYSRSTDNLELVNASFVQIGLKPPFEVVNIDGGSNLLFENISLSSTKPSGIVLSGEVYNATVSDSPVAVFAEPARYVGIMFPASSVGNYLLYDYSFVLAGDNWLSADASTSLNRSAGILFRDVDCSKTYDIYSSPAGFPDYDAIIAGGIIFPNATCNYDFGGFGDNDSVLYNASHFSGYAIVPQVYIDLTAPENDSYFDSSSVDLSYEIGGFYSSCWYVLENSTYSERVDIACGSGATMSVPEEGRWSVTIFANDTFGTNRSSETHSFAVDLTPPEITVLSPLAGDVLDNSNFSSATLNFTLGEPFPDYCEYQLSGATYIKIFPCSNGFNSIPLYGLLNEDNYISLFAYDKAGHSGFNSTNVYVNLTYEDRAPQYFNVNATNVFYSIDGYATFSIDWTDETGVYDYLYINGASFFANRSGNTFTYAIPLIYFAPDVYDTVFFAGMDPFSNYNQTPVYSWEVYPGIPQMALTLNGLSGNINVAPGEPVRIYAELSDPAHQQGYLYVDDELIGLSEWNGENTSISFVAEWAESGSHEALFVFYNSGSYSTRNITRIISVGTSSSSRYQCVCAADSVCHLCCAEISEIDPDCSSATPTPTAPSFGEEELPESTPSSEPTYEPTIEPTIEPTPIPTESGNPVESAPTVAPPTATPAPTGVQEYAETSGSFPWLPLALIVFLIGGAAYYLFFRTKQ